MPTILGVSKAILENVIFCHQEDSLWPLSEPSVLKKKFDDIFASTRFTKALDHTKAHLKDRLAELKVNKNTLEFLKADREKAAKAKNEIDKAETRIEEINTELEEHEQEITEVSNRLETLMHSRQKYQTTALQIQKFEHERKVLDAAIVSLLASLEDNFEETDQELADLLENLNSGGEERENNLQQKKLMKIKLEADVNSMQGELTKWMVEEGKLKSENEKAVALTAEREAAISSLKPRLAGVIDTSGGADEIIARLQAKIHDLDKKISDLHSKQGSEEENCRKQIRALESELAIAEEQKKMLNAQYVYPFYRDYIAKSV